MEQQHIDELLERYLGLLDEYTRLRQDLSRLQSGVYQNIARANFSGERGMRYGSDHYDERMQALRLLAISVGEGDVPEFTIAVPEAKEQEEKNQPDDSTEAKKDAEENVDDKAEKPKAAKPRNPLHWFGLLAPMPLRTAQNQSIQAVEEAIPRLVSVNAEMLSVEIEVRRARKRRAKAAAAGEKQVTSGHDNAGEANSRETQSQTTPVEAT